MRKWKKVILTAQLLSIRRQNHLVYTRRRPRRRIGQWRPNEEASTSTDIIQTYSTEWKGSDVKFILDNGPTIPLSPTDIEHRITSVQRNVSEKTVSGRKRLWKFHIFSRAVVPDEQEILSQFWSIFLISLFLPFLYVFQKLCEYGVFFIRFEVYS